MSSSLEMIIAEYGKLLQSVDHWFVRSAVAAGTAVQCGEGCSSCCRGLFDITLLDAYYLRRGFDGLENSIQEMVLSRVVTQRETLRSTWPEISLPYIINALSEVTLLQLMPEEDPTPCPLLGSDGRCLVYEHRPMTCRLHGIPLVDISGELFHDEWCTHNFTKEDPLSRHDLRWEFRDLFKRELLIFQDFTNVLLNQRINELDTLLPLALLIDFERFDWKGWWLETSEKFRNVDFQESHQSCQSHD